MPGIAFTSVQKRRLFGRREVLLELRDLVELPCQTMARNRDTVRNGHDAIYSRLLKRYPVQAHRCGAGL